MFLRQDQIIFNNTLYIDDIKIMFELIRERKLYQMNKSRTVDTINLLTNKLKLKLKRNIYT